MIESTARQSGGLFILVSRVTAPLSRFAYLNLRDRYESRRRACAHFGEEVFYSNVQIGVWIDQRQASYPQAKTKGTPACVGGFAANNGCDWLGADLHRL